MTGIFKTVGAGLASMALIGAGVGIGLVFSALITGVARSEKKAELMPIALLGFALCEATGLFGLMIAFIILFA